LEGVGVEDDMKREKEGKRERDINRRGGWMRACWEALG
jgi:hypothetical protein